MSPYLQFGVELLELSQPLPDSSTGFTPTGVWPLVMVLSNGDQCEVIQGTGQSFGKSALSYACNGGYASSPLTTSGAWSISYLANGAESLITLAVTTAWE